MVWNYVLSIIGELELSEIPRLPADIEYRGPNNGSYGCDYTLLNDHDLLDNKLMIFEAQERRWKIIALRNKESEINVVKFTNFNGQKDVNKFWVSSCRHGSSRYKGSYTEACGINATFDKQNFRNEDVIQLFLSRQSSGICLASSRAYQTFIDYLIAINCKRVKRMITWMSKERVKCISKQGRHEVTMFNKLEPFNVLREILEYI
jgi:hypothetical protein